MEKNISIYSMDKSKKELKKVSTHQYVIKKGCAKEG